MISTLALLLAQAKSDTWKPVFLPGGYSIQCPSPPERLNAGSTGEAAPKGVKAWISIGQRASYAFYLQTVETKEAEKADLVLAGAVFGLIEDGNLTNQKDLILNGWPGLEFEYSSPDGATHGRSRVYMIGKELFQAAAWWMTPKGPDDDVTRFLGSMMSPDKMGRGPLKVAGPTFTDYKLEGAGITVRFPSKPVKSEFKIGTPEVPGKVIRFEGDYGNREYTCVFTDVPKELFDPGQDIGDHEEEVLQTLNDLAMKGREVKSRHDTNYSIGKHKVLSTTAKLPHGGMIRADTFLSGTRVFSVICQAPEALLGTEEVKAYFASIKLDEAP